MIVECPNLSISGDVLERERKMIIIFSKRLELWLTRPKRALEENFLSGAKDVATYE